MPPQYRGSVRSINEYPLDPAELEFINTLNAYRQRYQRPFPTWSEVLHIVRFLGYRKVAEPGGGEVGDDLGDDDGGDGSARGASDAR